MFFVKAGKTQHKTIDPAPQIRSVSWYTGWREEFAGDWSNTVLNNVARITTAIDTRQRETEHER